MAPQDPVRILHLSDTHFHSTTTPEEENLLSRICSHNPDITIITGDVTYNGTTEQLYRAREFIENIPGKKLVVPGNTDISIMPTYTEPSKKKKTSAKYINTPHGDGWWVPLADIPQSIAHLHSGSKPRVKANYDLWLFEDFFQEFMKPVETEQVLAYGLDSTARVDRMKRKYKGAEGLFRPWHDGAVVEKELSGLEQKFKEKGDRLGIAALHHPLTLPVYGTNYGPFYKWEKILERFWDSGVNLVLAGHKHVPELTSLPPHGTNGSLHLLTGNTLFSSDVKSPYSGNGYFLIEKIGSGIEITYSRADGETSHMGGFSLK